MACVMDYSWKILPTYYLGKITVEKKTYWRRDAAGVERVEGCFPIVWCTLEYQFNTKVHSGGNKKLILERLFVIFSMMQHQDVMYSSLTKLSLMGW